jgi:hypothetical protein
VVTGASKCHALGTPNFKGTMTAALTATARATSAAKVHAETTCELGTSLLITTKEVRKHRRAARRGCAAFVATWTTTMSAFQSRLFIEKVAF